MFESNGFTYKFIINTVPAKSMLRMNDFKNIDTLPGYIE